MKINAYILAADPAWIEASVASYYDFVERIVVTYDADGIGYSGKPMDSTEVRRRLRAIDREHKMEFIDGHFCRPGHSPMDNETAQRRESIAHASAGADWILQIDSDEILPEAERLVDYLGEAASLNLAAVNYPSHFIYGYLHGRWFLACANAASGGASAIPVRWRSGPMSRSRSPVERRRRNFTSTFMRCRVRAT